MQSSSHLLHKTQCPKCAENGRDRSGDNLGVYSDGHSYCYSCGFNNAGTTTNKLRNVAHKTAKEIPALPEDISPNLEQAAYNWLLQYFPKEPLPRCLYSANEQKLFFMLDNGAYQYRYFGNNLKHPKWIGHGINENLIYICNSGITTNSSRNSSSIILVEDIISGIKVGHILPTLTLFGSNISLKRLAALKLLGYKEVIIWLDWDKKEYAIKAAQLAQSIGLQARVIHTKLDPKEYTIEEIRELHIPH